MTCISQNKHKLTSFFFKVAAKPQSSSTQQLLLQHKHNYLTQHIIQKRKRIYIDARTGRVFLPASSKSSRPKSLGKSFFSNTSKIKTMLDTLQQTLWSSLPIVWVFQGQNTHPGHVNLWIQTDVFLSSTNQPATKTYFCSK